MWKTKQKTEWQVCRVDEHGDIQDIVFCDTKKEGLMEFEREQGSKQLWRVVHTWQEDGDGNQDAPCKLYEELISEVLYEE